jgi:hypothetical protein
VTEKIDRRTEAKRFDPLLDFGRADTRRADKDKSDVRTALTHESEGLYESTRILSAGYFADEHEEASWRKAEPGEACPCLLEGRVAERRSRREMHDVDLIRRDAKNVDHVSPSSCRDRDVPPCVSSRVADGSLEEQSRTSAEETRVLERHEVVDRDDEWDVRRHGYRRHEHVQEIESAVDVVDIRYAEQSPTQFERSTSRAPGQYGEGRDLSSGIIRSLARRERNESMRGSLPDKLRHEAADVRADTGAAWAAREAVGIEADA